MIAEETDILKQIRTELPKVKRVLVFAPHPDDEIFGCGGTLALLHKQAAEIQVVVVTDGALGGGDGDAGLGRLRADESCAAAAVMGLDEPIFWGLPDRGLVYGELLIIRLMETIKEFDAELILLPALTELHPDHQVLALSGAEAIRRLGDNRLVAFYEINMPLPNPNLLLDISYVFEQKQAAMICFASQLAEQPYDQRIAGLNKIRSYFLGPKVIAAEAFLLVQAEKLSGGLVQLFDGPLAHRQKLGFAATPDDLPLISIIVRSMDRSTLARALDSLALQTWPNIEVIVVNAKGGEHGSLPQYCGNFPLHLHNQNGQPLSRPVAANTGLAVCSGRYIGFLDDDDSMDSEHLQQLVTLLASAKGQLAYAGIRGVTADGDSLKNLMEFKEPGVTFSRLLLGNIIPIHAVLFSRELLQQGATFDEHLDLYEDWDFWLQLTRQTTPLFVNRITATYYTGGSSAVGIGDDDTPLKQQSKEMLLAKWLPLLTAAELDAIGDLYRYTQGEYQSRLRALEQAFAEQQSHGASLQQALAEQQSHSASLQQALTEQQSHGASLQQALAEQQNHSASLQQALAEQQNHSVNLQQALTERDNIITGIYASRSWRTTAPLRWAGRQAHRSRLLIKSIPLAIDHAGGFWSCLTKGVAIVRSEGIGGVRHRLRMVLSNQAAQMPATWHHQQITSHSPGSVKAELKHHQQTVDIIVCVHNAIKDVKCCLESLQSRTFPPFRLIIVDDGSDQETAAYLVDFVIGQQAVLIRHEAARGYTCAANAGLRKADADFVVLLNSDTILTPRWLDRLIRCAESDPCIGIVGPLSNTASWQSIPQIFDEQGDWADNPLPAGVGLDTYAVEVARESNCCYPRVGFLNGFCLMIKREVINDIGLFDEEVFGRGYGEENDYCLRATAAKWQLAVADDCYVYHAQSKSYSPERRKKLAALADQALADKHGSTSIQAGINITRYHLGLAYVRQRCAQIPELLNHKTELLCRYEGKRVLFLLPAGTAGGGSNIVLLECRILRNLGVDACIANLQKHQQLFEQSHPGLDVPVIYLQTPEDLMVCAQSFDAVIATLYLTAFWMQPLQKLPKPPCLGYYIQDFEPDFFEQGSLEYKKALDSYSILPEMRLFTKTRWNAKVLQQHLGINPVVIGPSLDLSNYSPLPFCKSKTEGTVRIVAMVRPSTPRRAPAMTMQVLKQLKQQFKERITITTFGVNPQSDEYVRLGCDFEHDCHGELAMGDVWKLLATADIFVDCSSFQAMGLTAMEAMASGVAVVGPENGGLCELICHGVNGLLVDTTNQQAIYSAVAQLVEDSDLRYRIQEAGLGVVEHHPLYSVKRILYTLFPDAGGKP
ncbi:MAG: glycosyltransferase [Desulfuromonas sp.]|nr:glycosyltransferase [Desulfuromonas sp.]